MNRPSLMRHRRTCSICHKTIERGSPFLSVCSKRCSSERIRQANLSLASRKKEAADRGEKFVPHVREAQRPLTMLLWEAESGMEGWR